MAGLIAQKMEMTQIIKDNNMVPVTLLRIPALQVVQVKTPEVDWYHALVVSIMKGDEATYTREVSVAEWHEFKKGDTLTVELLNEVEQVTLTGVSKGRGFTGAMKRWNFSGGPGRVGSKFHRALGSIGTRKPRRTKPGKKMHGRHGNATQTLRKVPVELVHTEQSIVAVRGAVPGARNAYCILQF